LFQMLVFIVLSSWSIWSHWKLC